MYCCNTIVDDPEAANPGSIPEEQVQAAVEATLRVQITDVDLVGGVAVLRLQPVSTPRLPQWTAGAHIDLVLPSGLVRQYSLSGDPQDLSAYRIAVLRQDDGRGGHRRSWG